MIAFARGDRVPSPAENLNGFSKDSFNHSSCARPQEKLTEKSNPMMDPELFSPIQGSGFHRIYSITRNGAQVEIIR